MLLPRVSYTMCVTSLTGNIHPNILYVTTPETKPARAS